MAVIAGLVIVGEAVTSPAAGARSTGASALARPKSSTFTVPSGRRVEPGWPPAHLELDIRGLEIAVDDPLIVSRFERLGNLLRNRESFRERNRAFCDQLGKRRSFDKLHDQRMNPVRVFESVDVCDVRMVERRQHLRFALETRESLRVGGEEVRQNLDGHVTVQSRVACPVDFAHPAGPEGGQDFVAAEASAGS